jgi:SAM-dependent methyltransferase
MQYSQDEIFAADEGNRWFERNKDALDHFNPELDLPLKIMSLYHLKPHNVLEVGAANGYRLAQIAEDYRARVVAVEPSSEAIRDGKLRFPSVEFVQGVANEIPLEESFDLVIVNGVFCWIERATFLRSVAEIDRVLRDNGFLIIGDFYPLNQTKTRYHHLTDEEVYTYKQNYAATFLASGLYHTVCELTGSHSSKTLVAEVPEHERWGGWLLRKILQEHYMNSSLSHSPEIVHKR